LLFLKVLQVKKSRVILFFFAFILIKACLYNVWVVPVRADSEQGAEASLSLRGTYTDNGQFTGEEDYILEISPSVALSAVTEITQMQAAADIDIREYKNNNDLSSVDQYYQVLGGVALEERVDIDVVGTYLIDSTFFSELDETGIVIKKTKRHQAAVNPVGTFWLAPRDRMQLSYGYSDTSFNDDEFRDYTSHNLRIGWLHDLKNERTTLGFLVGANRTEYGDNIDNPNEDITDETVRAGLLLDHLFTERFIVNLKAGARHSRSETRGPDGNDTDGSFGFVGEVAASWLFEKGNLSARINQNVVPSSAGNSVNRTLVNLGLGYRFTEKLGCGLRGSYRRSDPLGGGQTVETFGAGASLDYRIYPKLDLSLGYSYSKTDQKSASVRDDETNRVSLNLRWLIHQPEWRVRGPKPLVKWPHRL